MDNYKANPKMPPTATKTNPAVRPAAQPQPAPKANVPAGQTGWQKPSMVKKTG